MKNKKKWELLKFAYDNYPKETRFKSALDGIEGLSLGIMSFSEIDFNSVNCNCEDDYVKYVYHNGKWAEIIQDKNPLLVTEDLVPLFEGDDCYCAIKKDGIWMLDDHAEIDFIDRNCFKIADNGKFYNDDNNKHFSTKEAALAWIEAQQPKEIEIELSHSCYIAKVFKDHIRILDPSDNYTPIRLKPSDIEAISNALKTLSK